MASLAQDKLIIALDVESHQRALALYEILRDVAGMFKIGSQLFTAAGPGLVREIVGADGKVFLDLKFHDIPNTVAAAGIEAARLGVSIFNVHASGGSEMMRRTAAAVSEVSEREALMRPKVIAVTVLTSMNEGTLAEIGAARRPEEQVTRLSALAATSGMDGVVASPREVAAIRATVARPEFLVVTPGVRPSGGDPGDQRRTMTPAEAVHAGADYLVIGRPIIAAPDPVHAARSIIDEIEALNSPPDRICEQTGTQAG